MTNREDAHILIVDDEPMGLYTLEMLLSSEPYRISFAHSGTEALAMIEKNAPDVILLDVMMPEVSGHAVCKRLKASSSWQHIPVILVTALNQSSDLRPHRHIRSS